MFKSKNQRHAFTSASKHVQCILGWRGRGKGGRRQTGERKEGGGVWREGAELPVLFIVLIIKKFTLVAVDYLPKIVVSPHSCGTRNSAEGRGKVGKDQVHTTSITISPTQLQ